MRAPAPFMLWLLSACSGGDAGTDGSTDLPPVCDAAPVVTWDNFGEGFIIEACQPCHASTTLDRHEAPPTVTFDDEEQVWLWATQVLDQATGESPPMPPRGGVSDDDRYLLEVWLSCGG